MQKIFTNKIIFSLGIFFAFTILPGLAQADVLLPGNINSCGELAISGTYTLTDNINAIGNTCFTISSDNVTINGAGHTIAGSGVVAIDARARSGEGTALVEGGNAYTNLIVNDVTFTGYTTGINISGNADTTGAGVNNGYAGDAGDVAVFYSRVGSVIADGGSATTKTSGGLGGNISFTDTNLDISNSTISTLGGSGTTGSNTNGGLDLNYTGTLTRTNLVLSALSFFNDNTTEYGVYPGGTWPITNTSLTTCGTLYGSGTFTLSQNVTATASCFTIASNSITINGNGYSIIGASTTDFAIKAGSYSSFTLASTTVSAYANLITSSSSVTISGHNLDLSNKFIAANSLTLTYTGTLTKTGATISSLTNLVVNGVSYGAQSAGALLDWVARGDWGMWTSIASSADGTKLVKAKTQGGNIYTSNDSGLTWTQRSPTGWFSAVSSSADGTKLAAVSAQNGSNGHIYTSVDSGVTWTQRMSDTTRNWSSISSSADGTKLAATVYGGYVYTSSDSGTTWAQRGTSGEWRSIALSADGLKIIGIRAYGSQIYISNDFGLTWSAKATAGSWNHVTSSADGLKIAVSTQNGPIYTSIDGGENWNLQNSGSRDWYGITSSADGSKLAAVAYNGQIYTSIDSGVTWVATASNKSWYGITSSADGTKLAAAVYGGYIYTYQTPNPTISVDILTPASGTITSWSPIVSWGTASSCYYSFDNWTSTSTASCSSLGSDIPRPASYGAGTLYVKGIDASGNVSAKSTNFNFTFGVTINTPASGGTIISNASTSWSPSINWDPSDAGNITSCLYSYDNFISTSTANCALGGVDILPYATTSNATTTLTVRVQDSNGNVGYASSTFFYKIWNYVGPWNFWYWSAGISANGLRMQIGGDASNQGPVYRSIDGGINWLNVASVGNRSWTREIAMASDGLRITMSDAVGGRYVYTTADGGVNWTVHTSMSGTRFQAISGSSDGKKLAAVVANDYVYTSTDFGASWVKQLGSGSRNWVSITQSADGSKLAATVSGGNVYTSTDYGITWTARTTSGSRSWGNIVSSIDGTRLASYAGNGFVYTSTDSGATWATSTSSGITNWSAVSLVGIGMSADGTKLIAVTNNHPTDGGSIYISNNFGTTWTRVYLRTATDGWSSGANWGFGTPRASADFTRILVPVGGGQVYTYYNPSSLSVDIFRPFESNTVNTWDPYISFGIAQTCQYSWNNTDWNTISCANAGSDIPNPGYGTGYTLYVKGTDIANNTVSKQVSFNYLEASTSTNLTACGTITSPGTYTLTTNLTGATTTCFTVLANNVTIDGAGHTVTASTTNTKYAVTASSTVSAYTNLTVKNITFTGFTGGGIDAGGKNNGSGRGGEGGNVTVSTSTMGAILTSAGHATGNTSQPGGNAGNIIVTNSTVGALTASGGNGASAWGAAPGLAGNITVTNSTVSGNVATLGATAGGYCSSLAGSDGGLVTITNSSVTGSITSQGGAGASVGNCGSQSGPGGNAGIIYVTNSNITATTTSQGGTGGSGGSGESRGGVGGNAALINISSSTVAAIVSRGGTGGNGGYHAVTPSNGNGVTGGNGSTIIIASSTFGNIINQGGTGGNVYQPSSGRTGGTGGNSGNITITGSDLAFATKNIYGLGGAGGTGTTTGAVGSSTTNLSLTYTSSFTDPALHSVFPQVLIYRADGQVQAGTNVASTTLLSTLPMAGYATPGNISACGNIYFSGTYTLTGNITNASTTCFTILADDVTIDGGGYSVSAGLGNTGYGIESTGKDGTIVKNITFTGFGGGVINSNQSVTFEDTDLDISGMTISAGNLFLSYTNTITAINATLSVLSNLMINNIDLGAFAGGLFNWGNYTISACGNIDNPGSYTLTQDIFDNSGNSCLDINTDLVYVDGNGHSIYTTASTSEYAINATQVGGAGYSNLSFENFNISGYNFGINAQGDSGFNGGNVVLNNITTNTSIVTANTSASSTASSTAGNAGNITVTNSDLGKLYANGGNGISTTTPTQGGNGGNVSIIDSKVGNVQSSGGNSSGDLNPGSDVGTYAGGTPGTYSISGMGSLVGTVTRNTGASYIPGCTDNSFPNYDSSATYNDGSCAMPAIGSGRDNPEGNTIVGPVTFNGFSNRGVVTGDATYYGYDVNGNFNSSQGNYGTTTGHAAFDDNWAWMDGPYNYGYVGGGADFSGAYPSNYGVIDGTTNFNGDYNYNYGTVNGDTNFWGWQGGNYGTINGNVYFQYYGGNSGIINGNVDFTGGNTAQAYNYNTVNGDAIFWDPYNFNYGTVTGHVSYVYGCTDTNAANYVDAAFDDGSCVYYGQNSDLPEGVTYTGDLTFSSCLSNYGTINGNATFDSCSHNYGTVTGNATFSDYLTGPSHDSTGNTLYVDGNFTYDGTGIVGGVIYDANSTPITSFDFSNGVSNPGTRVTNGPSVFNDLSYNDTGAIVVGTTTFNGTSANYGTITGDAIFNTTLYASTTPQNGIFSFENFSWYGNVTGTVFGSDLNPITDYYFYNSTYNSTTVSGNAVFNNSSYKYGNISGNATLNTTYYTGSLPTGSTLTLAGSAQWRGLVSGTIFASDGTTPITTINFSGSSSNYTTITGNSSFSGTSSNGGTVVGDVVFSDTASNNGTITGTATYTGKTFRIGTVNGTAILSGLAQTITGSNSVVNFIKQATTRDTLYITSGASLNVSGLFTLLGLDADNLLTVRSTNSGSYANLGINGTTHLDFLRLKDMRNTGPTLNLSTKTIFNDGGNSGFSFPSNSAPSQRVGITKTFSAPAVPVSRGGVATTNGGGTGNSVSGILRNLFNRVAPVTFNPIPTFTPLGTNFKIQNIGTTVIPYPFKDFKAPAKLTLVQLPSNFAPNVSRFLFAPLPNTITIALKNAPKLSDFIAAAGVSNEQELASLASKPLVLNAPENDIPPGHFVVKSGEQTITTYATYDSGAGGLAELIKVSPNQSLTIDLIPLSTGPVTATYLDQTINFVKGNNFARVGITSPGAGGRYVLKTASSPIPLLIEVVEPVKEVTAEKQGTFNWLWKWFK